jgi:hypothetical protein
LIRIPKSAENMLKHTIAALKATNRDDYFEKHIETFGKQELDEI